MNLATRSCVFTIFVLIFCSQHVSRAEGSCFFPNELQGEFIMQSIYMAESQVQYSRVNITLEAIPIWGLCYRRIGNNFILMDSSSGAANCIRCFQFTLRSRNVLQVKTEEFNRCYTSEEAAEYTCPRETDSNYKNLKEVLLYKTKELGGEEIRKEYCPIHGKFSFVYNVNGGGSENSMECGNHASELDTCNMVMPAASLNLHFRSCSFSDHDITFDCLGDWEGPDNQRYLALYDTQVTSHNSHPRYRCGMYQKDPRTGDINVAFSSDSTCTTSLVNSTFGYETLALKPLPEPAWPPKVSSSVSRFPSWMQGNWQHLSVANNVITYRDHSRYQTLTIHSMGGDNPFGERLPVYIRDECGGESYSCIWLKNRGANVLEFQLGIYPSAVYNDTLCHNENFNSNWITQGRLERLKESPCPITGQYTGFIPDATGLCAKLSSDCKSHEIMYYTLSECGQKDVYEGYRLHGYRNKRETDMKLGDKVFRVTNPRSTSTPEMDMDNITSTMILSTLSTDEVVSNDKDKMNTPIYTETNSELLNESAVESTTELNMNFNKDTSYDKSYINTTDPIVITSPTLLDDTQDSTTTRPTMSTTLSTTYVDYEKTNVNYTTQYATPSTGFITNVFYLENKRQPDLTYLPAQTVTRTMPPVVFHGSVSEIPFQRDVPYNNNFQRTNPNYNREWTPQFQQNQDRGRYIGTPPYPPVQNHPMDTRRNWQVQNAESHPVFISNPYQNTNSHKTPIALPPIQLPSPYPINNNHGVQGSSRRGFGSMLREEREYRCLGHWKEQDITYTYTQRKDTGIYECFVGLIVSNNEIYIKEAGEHCERNVVPINKGMKLSLEGACTANIPTLVPMPGGGGSVGVPPYTYTQRPPTVTWHTTRHPHATKSWKPITAPPKTIRNEISSSQMNAPAIWVIVGISNFVAFFLYF